MMGVAGVMSRIAELNQQLGLTPPATAPLDGADTTATTGTTDTGTSFASALAAATGGGAANSGVTGDAVVASAEKYLGTKYVFGSTDASKGLDCSALVQRAYKDLGIELPRIASEQARSGTRVDSLAAAKPGDRLTRRPRGHLPRG